MNYIEYRKSSIRHIQTCQKLLEILCSCKSDAEKQNILCNVYYISGYVIETSLSFFFFSSIGCEGDIETSTHYSNDKFKTHKFQKKIDYINTVLGGQTLKDIPIISNPCKDTVSIDLYENWSTDFRYVNKTKKIKTAKYFTEMAIRKYIGIVEEINYKLITRVS